MNLKEITKVLGGYKQRSVGHQGSAHLVAARGHRMTSVSQGSHSPSLQSDSADKQEPDVLTCKRRSWLPGPTLVLTGAPRLTPVWEPHLPGCRTQTTQAEQEG